MDKKTKIQDQNLRRIDKTVKDSDDDLLKPEKNKIIYVITKPLPDRGDTEKVTRNDKIKVNDKKIDDARLKTPERLHNLLPINNQKDIIKIINNKEHKVPLNYEERKKIREKYSFNNQFKINTAVKNVINKVNAGRTTNGDSKTDKYCKKINETPKNKNDSSDYSKKSENLKPEIETLIRRPIIKTITFKNDSTKIYKAVTFVDQRKQQATPVQIDIPNDGCKKPKVKSESSKIQMKASISRVSVKEKAVRRRTEHKKREKFKHARSPDLSVEIRSPPTEVAKWAPSSINSHTKQYYEAWVDTTLAAISKKSKEDKLFWENHHFMETFQRALAERPVSPDLIYENLADERYTGRIKVRHR